ncbi:MAG: TatD family hydrolase, partial [Bryobacterales bacterium]|nr:TatD family hydrolase [Bryobacterales bacterium]
LVDSHCHLDDRQFDADRDEVIARALANGVECMLAIGSGDGPPDLEAAIRLAERYPAIWATVGVHPHDARKADEQTWARMRELLRHPRVLAVGEIGLDYHYNFSAPHIQREVFERQLELAREARKPVVIHTREAWDDTLAILRRNWPASDLPCVMHCFSGGPEEARQCLDMGFHLSFAGVVTYPKAVRVQEAARLTPRDRLLLETDSPYLAPVPHRGRRNEPAYLVHTVVRLAELRGESPAELVGAASANFRRIFQPAT